MDNDPVPMGKADVVNLYSAEKLIVYVVLTVGETVWLFDDEKFQLWKMDRSDSPIVCGDGTVRLCADPDVQLNVCGAWKLAPSTVTARPAGEELMVTWIVPPVPDTVAGSKMIVLY